MERGSNPPQIKEKGIYWFMLLGSLEMVNFSLGFLHVPGSAKFTGLQNRDPKQDIGLSY